MKELQQKRNQTARDLHAAEERMTAMQREYARAAESGQSGSGSYTANEAPVNRTQVRELSEAARLQKAIQSLDREISDKRRDLADLDRAIAFYGEMASAETELQQAVETAKLNSQKLGALKTQRKELAERLETLKSDAAQALEDAIEHERSCADAYAKALRNNAAGTDAAGEAMSKASTALSLVKQQNAGKQQVFLTLEAELESLDKQISATSDAIEEAQRAAYRAKAIELGIRWDEQVTQLMSLGSELLAARMAAGMTTKELDKLMLPRFSTYRAAAADAAELKRMAAEVISH